MFKAANPIRTNSKLMIALMTAACATGVLTAALIVLVLWHSSLPVVRADSAASAERKLQQAEHDATTNSRTVRLTEDEVNSILHERLQKSGRLVAPSVDGLHDLRVRLIGDRIEAFFVLGRRGTEVTVDLEGKLYSKAGRIQFDPVAGRIGMLRLPQPALVSAMQKALSGPEQKEKLRLPASISDLRVENNQVLLRYN